jgi:hypothetical protein
MGNARTVAFKCYPSCFQESASDSQKSIAYLRGLRFWKTLTKYRPYFSLPEPRLPLSMEQSTALNQNPGQAHIGPQGIGTLLCHTRTDKLSRFGTV